MDRERGREGLIERGLDYEAKSVKLAAYMNVVHQKENAPGI
jgi:hypothetical protein